MIFETPSRIHATSPRYVSFTEFTPNLDQTCYFFSQSEYKGYVETLHLGTIRVPGEILAGRQLLNFRENFWLYTTLVLILMLVLRDEHPDVGIINPSFHDFCFT